MSEHTFDQLVAEGASVPVDGWDFSWFDGRATEERPSWGYARLMAARMADATSALDLQTGGGEVLAGIGTAPARLVATESWPPNLELARRNLRPLGGSVVAAADDAVLPFAADSFDLVTSRHPTTNRWDEIARVVRPGGGYLSQQIDSGTVRELRDAMLGPQPVRWGAAERSAEAVEAAGLTVVDLRQQALRMTFDDIGAIVHFLRKVIWIVPGFTVDAYRDRLAALHDRIVAEGPFVAHSQRFLIEARKPGRG